MLQNLKTENSSFVFHVDLRFVMGVSVLKYMAYVHDIN